MFHVKHSFFILMERMFNEGDKNEKFRIMFHVKHLLLLLLLCSSERQFLVARRGTRST